MSVFVDHIFVYLLLAIPIISFFIVRKKVKDTTMGTKIFIFVLISLFLFALHGIVLAVTIFWSRW